MKTLDFLIVFIGGGFGGCLRYLFSSWIGKTENFPTSTLVVNVLACVLAGFLISKLDFNLPQTSNLKLFVLTGFCGGFSTFSAFGLESFGLIQRGLWFQACVYIFISVAAGIAGVALGLKLNP